MKCRDPNHKFFGDFAEILHEKGLVRSDGSVDPHVKNIVLSAITGEGLHLRMQSPLFGERN
jgi:hypothetical protein